MENLVGKSIGNTKIEELIADGGMATVYKAFHEQLEVYRALKIMKPEAVAEADRFFTEAKIIANLNSPYIVQCHSFGKYEGKYPYIEMEYVEGKDLYFLLEEKEQIPPFVSLSIMHSVCKALITAHNCEYTLYGERRRGIIHRDIKPANILISNDGKVKLTDFGIAKAENLDIHTGTVGGIVGSSYYLSPEQLSNEELDQRSDIYSLGCVLYEMVTGYTAFYHENIAELVMHKMNNDYDKEKLKKLPEKMQDLIIKTLQPKKKDRYENAGLMLHEINTILMHNGITDGEEEVKSFIKDAKDYEITTSIRVRKIKRKNLKINMTRGVIAAVAVLILSVFYFGYLKIEESGKGETNIVEVTVQDEKEEVETDKEIQFEASSKKDKKEVRKRIERSVKAEKGEGKKKAVNKLDILKEKYGTGDSFLILKKAVNNKSYNDAGDIIEHCSFELHEKRKYAVDLMDRMLKLRQFSNVYQVFSKAKIEDGYFEYILGRAAKELKKPEEAQKHLKKALMVSSEFIAPDEMKNKSLYYLALINEDKYKKEPNEQNRIKAVNAWGSLKARYENSKDSYYYSESEKRLKKLALK